MKSEKMMAFFIIFCLLVNWLSASLINAQEVPPIIFTEIMYDLEGADSGGEWVEVYNRGSQTVEIIGGTGAGSWRFSDGSNHTLNLVQGDLLVEPAEAVVLTADAAVFLEQHPGFAGTVIDTVMSLGNTGETIALSNDAGQTFFVQMTYQSSWGGNGNGYSLEKIDLAGGDESANWQQSAALGGTPGQVSQNEPPQPQEDQPPMAEAGLDQVVSINTEVLFDGSNSFDPDGDELNYSWDLGDGEIASGTLVSHSYSVAESYTVTLTVTDGQLTDQDSLIIEVIDSEPEPGPNSDNGGGGGSQPAGYAAEVIINEFLPNPQGSDDGEFIELFNKSYEAADLVGWQLQDNSSRVYTIAEDDFSSTEVAPGGYFVITRDISGIALNNTGGDKVILYRPDGYQVDMEEYEIAAMEGRSLARKPDGWAWTSEVTPGAANSFIANQPPEAKFNVSQGKHYIDDEAEFDGSLSSDPDGDNITYHWDFGDQSSGDEAKENHVYETAGSYNVVLTVTDTQGLVDSSTKQLTINPAPVEVTIEPSASSTAVIMAGYNGLLISEFLPNPQGSDEAEWIELFNNSAEALDLSNLFLDDAEGGSRPFSLSGQIINPSEYLLVSRADSKIALNNSADSVRLITPAGPIIQEVIYEKSQEARSYCFSELLNDWLWCEEPTPGQANLLPNLEELVMSSSAEVTPTYQLAEVKELAKGSAVVTWGMVTAAPGALGQRVFYLAEADLANQQVTLSSGMEIYSSSVQFPEVNPGDVVELSGKVSEVQGKKRINLQKDSQFNLIDRWELPMPEMVATGEATEDLIGSLITMSGTLLEKKGDNYYLDDGSGEIKVYLKKTAGIPKPEVEVGYIMNVTGILDSTTAGYRLLPRSADDVSVGQILGATAELALSDEVINVAPGQEHKKVTSYLLFGAGGAMVIIVSLIIKYRFRKIFNQ